MNEASRAARMTVIGLGAQGVSALSPALLDRVRVADWLVAGSRWLSECDALGLLRPEARRIPLTAQLNEVIDCLRERGSARVVILASGDPGFHGIAGTLLRHFSADALEIIPNITTLQAAFALAGLDWSDAALVSAHAHPLAHIVGWARRARVMGILTDSQRTPAVIARTLLDAGLEDCRAIVAENLGLPEQRLTDARLSELPARDFAPLNVILLVRPADWQPHPVFSPRADDAYAHRRGLITKAEVRALSLARLALRETDIVWDIGAGSGAVSIEMAALAWRGRVYAIERDAENLAFLRENIARHGAANVEVVAGAAPEALAGLPAPDAVFIGGTGGAMRDIVAEVARRARPDARLVITLAALEHVSEALSILRHAGLPPDVLQVNIARGQRLPMREESASVHTRLSPLNPVFLVSARVGAEKDATNA